MLGECTQCEEILLAVGRQRFQWQFYVGRVSGSNLGEIHLTVLNGLAVAFHCPAEGISFQSDEIVPVGDLYLVRGEGEWFEMDILQYLLHFVDVRVRGAVGSNQAVGTEVGVVDDAYKSHVAAKSPDVALVLVLDGKRLVHPVPNETALQLVVLVNQVPVVLEVTYTVTHGMGIFAENHGAGITLVHVLAQPPDACVHGAIDVALRVVTTPFVLYGTGGVYLLGIVIQSFEVLAVARLVAHRPGDDGGVVAVACNHAAHALHERHLPVGIVGKGLILVEHHAMALDVGFVYHIKSEFCAKLVPRIVVRVVAVAYTVQVELLHQLDVVYHGPHGDGTSIVRVVLVTVHPLEEDGLAVNHLHAVHHFHGTETEKVRKGFLRFPLCIKGADYQRVGVRCFGIPGSCIREHLLLGKQSVCGRGYGLFPVIDNLVLVHYLDFHRFSGFRPMEEYVQL